MKIVNLDAPEHLTEKVVELKFRSLLLKLYDL